MEKKLWKLICIIKIVLYGEMQGFEHKVMGNSFPSSKPKMKLHPGDHVSLGI